MSLLLACSGDERPRPPPEAIGPEVYALTPGFGGDSSYVLYRDEDLTTVQLQSFAPDGRFEYETLATLEDDTRALVSAAFEELEAGELGIGEFDPECLAALDRPQVTLTTPSRAGWLRFGYPWACPPAGLEPLDEVFRELVAVLPDCSPSLLVGDCTSD